MSPQTDKYPLWEDKAGPLEQTVQLGASHTVPELPMAAFDI